MAVFGPPRGRAYHSAGVAGLALPPGRRYTASPRTFSEAQKRPYALIKCDLVLSYAQKEKRHSGPLAASEQNGIKKRPRHGAAVMFLGPLLPLWAAFRIPGRYTCGSIEKRHQDRPRRRVVYSFSALQQARTNSGK